MKAKNRLTIDANPCSSCRRNEAAFGCEATVKSEFEISLAASSVRDYDGFAAGRSLAELVSCYGALTSAIHPYQARVLLRLVQRTVL